MKKGSDYLLELQLNRREKVLFLRVAEKRMKEKKLTKKQLAEKINRPYGTVRNYFYDLSTISSITAFLLLPAHKALLICCL